MIEILKEYPLEFALVVFSLALGIWLYRIFLKVKMKLRMRRIRRQGNSGELSAEEYLRDVGFVHIQNSNTHKFSFWVDDEERHFHLKPDIIAELEGEAWLIEVKNGKDSSLGNRNTRRQLLEYQVNYPDHRVALFDAISGNLFEIDFKL